MSFSTILGCFLVGDDKTFPVIREESWTVGCLKKAIKDRRPTDLKDVDDIYLELYRVEIDDTHNREMRINELKQLSRNLKDEELDEDNPLSVYFDRSPPQGKKYYIIVQISKGESIYCGGVVLMAGGVDATE